MKKLIYWLPVIIWVSVIFFLSSNPVASASAIDWQDFLVKKTAHVIEYAILFILLYRATKNVLISLLFVVIYAATDEYHQTFVFGRTGKLRDVLIDAGGGVIGWLIIRKLLPKAPLKLKNWAKKLELI
ncbi:VanZ family protein [Candidatus Shapirobacteria bacterium CG08_land_8_20_14_0_20_39_18]|uniref:VanZ family protein n=1 Tax=Candidatus Shapirobacteria bacterium CG08_land_8_20_14_0_20_39_18 TaxID=1974883 RepID=A0A2M6XDN5_9BACT|nr:MAG: VanZ family protein [Candidatus Shapirobacteria bacterium CG08_land_8_20_14_0_20_39_18]PIY66276.1 MAG: VanZ family protein [Candidatus Shapirobacteria bacterium CG_4_10_14_0_8_um_filter_39_15]PJE68682.1 MAG: VanZ family protein [Candidatus Shapirobacteria bacterium CG10_big_fil_rev_8_21_14_0_10_38_8]